MLYHLKVALSSPPSLAALRRHGQALMREGSAFDHDSSGGASKMYWRSEIISRLKGVENEMFTLREVTGF